MCSNKSHIIYTVACKITKFYNDFGNIINEISRAGLCGMGEFWISSSTPHHSLFVDVSSMILFLMLHWWDVGWDEHRQLNFPTNKWPWHFFTNRNWHAAFEAKKEAHLQCLRRKLNNAIVVPLNLRTENQHFAIIFFCFNNFVFYNVGIY